MTKKEYCENLPTVAYYSGMGGLEVKFIEYGTDDHVYLVAGAWNGKKSYHRLKICSLIYFRKILRSVFNSLFTLHS
mgnify:CR=1 FL=1